MEFHTGRTKFEPSIVGVPQGGIISPILSNLILHELDKYMEKKAGKLDGMRNTGVSYRSNPIYHRLTMKISRLVGKIWRNSEIRRNFKEQLTGLIKERRKISSLVPNPKTPPKIKYIRYADD